MSHSKERESQANYEFKWGKKRGQGAEDKEVQFYESFTFEGEEYFLYDCVYLYDEDVPEPYIGKLVKIWEKSNRERKIKVLWFFCPIEIRNWLRDDLALKNEIFLACGEGLGLTNVNPLEVIVGKCNVICTSKDKRNPQPSDTELKMADYIFYRTFDVGTLTISDKIEDRKSAIDVRYIFNRKEGQNPSDIPIIIKNMKAGNWKKDANDETFLMQWKSDSSKSLDTAIKDIRSGRQTSSGKKDAELIEAVGISGRTEPFSAEKANPRSNIDSEKDESKYSKVPIRVEYRNNLKSVKHLECLDVSENRPSQNLRLDDTSAKFSTELPPNIGLSFTLRREQNDSCLWRRRVISDGFDGKASETPGSISHDKAETRSTKDFVGQRSLDHSGLPEPSKEMRHCDSSAKFSVKSQPNLSPPLTHRKGESDSGLRKLRVGSEMVGVKSSKTPRSTSDDKARGKHVQDSVGRDKGQLKKAMIDVDIRKPFDTMLHKTASVSSGKGIKTDDQIVEVKRPDADRTKWFKKLPWEDEMQIACEQQRLVVLYNLDPSYTSSEVEDVILNIFKESCTAKVIPQTAFSSPYSGQAIVIFKSKEASEKTLRKLDNGNLMFPNGRVLIGERPPRMLEGHAKFFGHLAIDKVKMQARGETKNAVSTAHFSQANTIEYQMAMVWRLQEARSEFMWCELYKGHEEELKELQNILKTK